MSRLRLLVAIPILALAIGGLAPLPAEADQQDARLDDLFVRLKTTGDPSEAAVTERLIWTIWAQAEDDAINRMMVEGIEAMARRQYGRALQRFDRIVLEAPSFAEGWNKRATVHYLMGNFRASVVDIQRTLRLEPRHFGALSGLGLIYDALEQPKAALRSFEAALAINPHLTGARERVEALRREVGGDRT